MLSKKIQKTMAGLGSRCGGLQHQGPEPSPGWLRVGNALSTQKAPTMCTTEKGADGLLVVQGRPESFPNVGVHMQSFIRQQLLRHMDMEKLKSLLKRSWVEGPGRQLPGCGAGSAICSTRSSFGGRAHQGHGEHTLSVSWERDRCHRPPQALPGHAVPHRDQQGTSLGSRRRALCRTFPGPRTWVSRS